ncbi:MAG: hypothetical protein ACFFG0_23300 [Candidatus Thorarchaeota archaeon]
MSQILNNPSDSASGQGERRLDYAKEGIRFQENYNPNYLPKHNPIKATTVHLIITVAVGILFFISTLALTGFFIRYSPRMFKRLDLAFFENKTKLTILKILVCAASILPVAFTSFAFLILFIASIGFLVKIIRLKKEQKIPEDVEIIEEEPEDLKNILKVADGISEENVVTFLQKVTEKETIEVIDFSGCNFSYQSVNANNLIGELNKFTNLKEIIEFPVKEQTKTSVELKGLRLDSLEKISIRIQGRTKCEEIKIVNFYMNSIDEIEIIGNCKALSFQNCEITGLNKLISLGSSLEKIINLPGNVTIENGGKEVERIEKDQPEKLSPPPRTQSPSQMLSDVTDTLSEVVKGIKENFESLKN